MGGSEGGRDEGTREGGREGRGGHDSITKLTLAASEAFRKGKGDKDESVTCCWHVGLVEG